MNESEFNKWIVAPGNHRKLRQIRLEIEQYLKRKVEIKTYSDVLRLKAEIITSFKAREFTLKKIIGFLNSITNEKKPAEQEQKKNSSKMYRGVPSK